MVVSTLGHFIIETNWSRLRDKRRYWLIGGGVGVGAGVEEVGKQQLEEYVDMRSRYFS